MLATLTISKSSTKRFVGCEFRIKLRIAPDTRLM